MIAFVLRSVFLWHLLSVELWCLDRAVTMTPDVSAIVVAFCVHDLRASRVAYVLTPLALGRSVLLPGSLAFHLWLLLATYCVAYAMTRMFFAERWQLRIVMAFLIAMAMSWAQGELLTERGADPLGRGVAAWLLTAIAAPGAAVVLELLYRSVVRAPGPEPRMLA